MNKQLNQRIRFLESQLSQNTPRRADEVGQSTSGLSLRISDRGSPSSYGALSSQTGDAFLGRGDYPKAIALYTSLGFTRWETDVLFSRDAGHG